VKMNIEPGRSSARMKRPAVRSPAGRRMNGPPSPSLWRASFALAVLGEGWLRSLGVRRLLSRPSSVTAD